MTVGGRPASLLIAAVAALSALSCGNKAVVGAGPRYVLPSDLDPMALTYTADNLTVNRNMRVPVTVKYTRSGQDLKVELIADGDVFEEESYRHDGNNFVLVNVALTTFEGPIPLLKFPLTVGQESWEWKGRMISGGAPLDAVARVTTSEDGINLPGGRRDAVRVDVKLQFVSGSSQASRRMSFWFVEKKGLVRREIEDTSEREPVNSGG